MRAARIGLNSINGFNLRLQISSNINNLNLIDLAVQNKWNSTIRKTLRFQLTINNNVTIGSTSYNIPALNVSGFPENSKITIINNGNIWGAGGLGGAGGAGTNDINNRGNNGTNGGDAILLNNNITLINNGTIYGGGGGGGGGGGYYNYSQSCRNTYRCDHQNNTWSTGCSFIGDSGPGQQCSSGCNFGRLNGKCKCGKCNNSNGICCCWVSLGTMVFSGTTCSNPVINSNSGGGGGFGRGSNNANAGSGIIVNNGGSGGNGGGFGLSGNNGSIGYVSINGTVTRPGAGSSGLSGHYIKNKTRVTFINNGTVLGRYE
jgi:hypothetical protein